MFARLFRSALIALLVIGLGLAAACVVLVARPQGEVDLGPGLRLSGPTPPSPAPSQHPTRSSTTPPAQQAVPVDPAAPSSATSTPSNDSIAARRCAAALEQGVAVTWCKNYKERLNDRDGTE